jgi:hypothetical protein
MTVLEGVRREEGVIGEVSTDDGAVSEIQTTQVEVVALFVNLIEALG